MSDNQTASDDPNKVMRGKPPREHQFKPGQSGNPAGRPKGTKQIDALIEEELDRRIEVTLSGRRTRLSKRQIMVRQIVDKALKGDHKAIATCMALHSQQKAKSPSDKTAEKIPDEIDTIIEKEAQILKAYIERGAGACHV